MIETALPIPFKKGEIMNKEEKKLIKKRGYDRHYFLEKLGVPLKYRGTNFCDNTDKRHNRWVKERKKYGFDSKETWSLDYTFYVWLYEHLMMYKKEAFKVVDLDYHKFDVDGKEYTQRQLINRLLKDLRYIMLNDYYMFDKKDYEKIQKRTERIHKLWGIVIPAMWW